jgi:hypothetical protein
MYKSEFFINLTFSAIALYRVAMTSYSLTGIRKSNALNAELIPFESEIDEVPLHVVPWSNYTKCVQVSIRKSHNPHTGPEVVISWNPTEVRSDLVHEACKVMTLADLAENLNHL